MTYITIKNPDTEGWTQGLDEVTKIFGWSNHYRFWSEMEAWCAFIDATIPDWFPLNYVQSGLISIVKFIYDQEAKTAFANGVDLGKSIVGKVNDTITWAQNQISSAVTDMRNRIDTEIVEPVRQKAAQIEQSLKDAQSKLSDMGISIDGFNTDVNTMKSNITSFGDSIKAFDGKLGSFDFKLTDLNNLADTLDSQLKDAQAALNQHKASIDDLITRVKNLEAKQDWLQYVKEKLGL